MKITKESVLGYINDVNRDSIFIYPNIEAAADATGTSPRSIKYSIKNRSTCRNGISWDYAWNVIIDAREMVAQLIRNWNWFYDTFDGIENIEEIV